MTEQPDRELEALRRIWSERRDRLRDILRRFDTRGMTRPARDPEERAWLKERGQGGLLVEDESAAVAARSYYERRYRRPG